jgi:deazaflavin-dependent oxidoreductase (nitroreductase family)
MSRETVKKRTVAVIRWSARILGILLLMYLGLVLLVLVFIIALRELRSFRDRVRQFNKKYLNPSTLTFAGRPRSPYAILHHVGRRSGHSYTTPVVADPIPDGFVIPLPYGADTDWCRNVLAAGRCTIKWNGSEYAAGEPEMIDSTGLSTLPPRRRLAWRLLGMNQFLKVRRLVEVPQVVSAAV